MELRKPTIDLVKDFCRLMVRAGQIYESESEQIALLIKNPIKEQVFIDLAKAAKDLDMDKDSFVSNYFTTGLLTKYKFGSKIKIDKAELDLLIDKSKCDADTYTNKGERESEKMA